MNGRIIAVANRSSLVSNDQLTTICAAIQTQIILHAAPAWDRLPCNVKFYTDENHIPNYAWTIFVIDNDAQIDGALGYHQEVADKVDGYIMCEPILSNGGVVMNFNPNNPGNYTISGTLSHEILETFINRFTNCWYDIGDGTLVCAEISDPVEQLAYSVNVNGTNVSVSDFIFPSWFNGYASSPINAPFNYLKTLTEPFSILSGGYIIQMKNGQESQVFGKTMPEWRKNMKNKKFSRMNRRKI